MIYTIFEYMSSIINFENGDTFENGVNHLE